MVLYLVLYLKITIQVLANDPLGCIFALVFKLPKLNHQILSNNGYLTPWLADGKAIHTGYVARKVFDATGPYHCRENH